MEGSRLRADALDGRGTDDARQLIRVLVFDDHVLMRQGLQTMLGLIEFVQAARVTGALDDVQRSLAEECSDVLILPSGETASARDAFLLAQPYALRTLVLARSDEHLNETLRAFATGHLIGQAFDAEHLAQALRNVVGRPPLGWNDAVTLRARSMQMGGRGRDLLTPREQHLLALVVDGYTDQQIAQRVRIKTNSAKKAVALVRAKLGCRNRAELIARVLREGLLPRSPISSEPRFVLNIDAVTGGGQASPAMSRDAGGHHPGPMPPSVAMASQDKQR